MSTKKFRTAALVVAVVAGLGGAAWAQRPFRAGEPFRGGDVCLDRNAVTDNLNTAMSELAVLQQYATTRPVRAQIAVLRRELDQLAGMFSYNRDFRRGRASLVCVDRDTVFQDLAAINAQLRILQRNLRFERFNQPGMRSQLAMVRRQLRELNQNIASAGPGRRRY